MSKKNKEVLICCILLSVSCVTYATESASKNPVDTKAITEIVEEVDNLASINTSHTKVFAKELVDVLSEHNVSFPDKLVELKIPDPPINEIDISQYKLLSESSSKIFDICRDSVWAKDPNRTVPVSLRNDLLVTIVDYCPHSLARLEAARWLAERAFGDDEMPKYKPDVSIELADTVCMSSIKYVLNIPPKDDAIYFMSLAFGADLTLKHVTLANEAGKQFNQEEVDKILADFNSRIKAVREIATDEDHISTMDRYEKRMSDIQKQIEMIAQIDSLRQELVPVIKGFLDAINEEDKSKLKQYVNESNYKMLEQSKSLRKDVLQLSDVREIKFQSVGSFSTSIKKDDKTIVSFSINIIAIKEDGSQIEKTLDSVPAVKTSQGWLIGSE